MLDSFGATIDEWLSTLRSAATLEFEDSLNDGLLGVTEFDRSGFHVRVDSTLPPDGYPPDSAFAFYHFRVRDFEWQEDGQTQRIGVLSASGPTELTLPTPARRVALWVGVAHEGYTPPPAPSVSAKAEDGSEVGVTVVESVAMEGSFYASTVIKTMSVFRLGLAADDNELHRVAIGGESTTLVHLLKAVAYEDA